MGNRMFRSARRNWRRIAVGAGGALVVAGATTGLVLSGTTPVSAHGLVDSGKIKQQTIRSGDISHNGVGASELRGPAHPRGPAVRSYHVKDQGLGHWDIKDGTLGGWDVRDGSLKAKELHKNVWDKIEAEDDKGGGEVTHPRGPKANSTSDLDGTVDLPADSPQSVVSSDLSGPSFVSAHVTVSGEGSNNNAVCELRSGGDVIAEGNEKLGTEAAGQQNASITLSGVATGEQAVLHCRTGNGGVATDISMTTLAVTTD